MNDPLSILLHELSRHARHDSHDDRVRLAARLRARDACEYCLLKTEGGFHIDHIIPPDLWAAYTGGELPHHPPRADHNGPHHLDNLAWCCPYCNGRKGQHLSGRIACQQHRLFNPRVDHWPDHFIFVHEYLQIVGLTPIGQITVKILGFNRSEPMYGPLAIRHMRHLRGQFPPAWARDWRDTVE